jgi:hypothetical protein
MQYQCEKCKTLEVVWNSRDGVTPYIIKCRRCNGEMSHVRWDQDDCFPTYVPYPDERVFVNTPKDVARLYAKMRIKLFTERRLASPPEDEEAQKELEDSIMEDIYGDGNAPWLITI